MLGHDWAFEKTLLAPLPGEPFDTALTLTPRVDRYAQVMVRCNQYSVPARFIGHRLRVKLSASAVVVYDRNTVVARHQRAIGKGAKVLDLDHYLEILLRKPGALPGATALAQARAAKVFTAEHEAFWAAARKAHGDGAGTRALVEVLLLHRYLDRADVLAGITAALSVGSTSPDVVALEARKAAERRGTAAGPDNADRHGRVVVLAEHRRAAPCSLISVRYPRWSSTTVCWGGKAHDAPAQCHRAGRRPRPSSRAVAYCACPPSETGSPRSPPPPNASTCPT